MQNNLNVGIVGCGVIGGALINWLNNSFPKNVLIGGVPSKIIKKNISWDPRSYSRYMAECEKDNLYSGE